MAETQGQIDPAVDPTGAKAMDAANKAGIRAPEQIGPMITSQEQLDLAHAHSRLDVVEEWLSFADGLLQTYFRAEYDVRRAQQAEAEAGEGNAPAG